MDNDIDVVDKHPTPRRLAFNPRGPKPLLRRQLAHNMIRYGSDMDVRVTRSDDEEIGCIGEYSEVQHQAISRVSLLTEFGGTPGRGR